MEYPEYIRLASPTHLDAGGTVGDYVTRSYRCVDIDDSPYRYRGARPTPLPDARGGTAATAKQATPSSVSIVRIRLGDPDRFVVTGQSVCDP